MTSHTVTDPKLQRHIDRALRMAARPQGLTRKDVEGIVGTLYRPLLRQEVDTMLELRVLHCVADPIDRRKKVMFLSPAAGAAWLASLPPDRPSPWRNAPAKRAATRAKKSPPRAPKAPKAPHKPVPITFSNKRSRAVVLESDAEVIVPANVKRTVGPSHPIDSRYQCDPSTRVVGGFASMGPGRYLEGVRP